ncbi:MAG: RNA 2',3'-cyclic phosphodiesterase [Burkholderiales bacterium]
MRLFFASWPPPPVAEALAAWAGEARRDCGGRPTPAGRIHLTLAFLGDADVQAAKRQAAEVRLPACAFRVEQARYWARNRIVWAGPAETPPALAALAAALGETRRFAAHVTLIRKARTPRRLPPLPALDWPVEAFRLVNSAPGREGPDYEVLGRYALE